MFVLKLRRAKPNCNSSTHQHSVAVRCRNTLIRMDSKHLIDVRRVCSACHKSLHENATRAKRLTLTSSQLEFVANMKNEASKRCSHNETLEIRTKESVQKKTKTKIKSMTRRVSKSGSKMINFIAHQMILVSTSILIGSTIAFAADDFFPTIPRPLRFASDTTGNAGDSSTGSTPSSAPTAVNRSTGSGSSFVWQPLPLRATFRPLNRQSQPQPQSQPQTQPPQPPRPPRPPQPPTPPEPLALISERSISDPTSNENLFATSNRFGSAASAGSSSSSSSSSASLSDDFFTPTSRGTGSDSSSSAPASNFFQPPPPPPPPSTTPAPITTVASTNFLTSSGETTPRPLIELDDDLPTRQPSNRFRPTKAPSDDANIIQSQPSTQSANSTTTTTTNGGSGNSDQSSRQSSPRMSSECFECICEASTNCNTNSRCQTSDVRRTRCGMFLISYDQWLATGLSRELVTREALARDAAADERAFYDCVTTRECSERLLAIYMLRNQKDCDKDGRIDCYDYAAIHHSGQDQCASESLLDSQYWNDFNACLGFGR